MYKIHIFIRKKAGNNYYSVERFAETLEKISNKENLQIRILRCPVISKGFFRRLYLIIWSYFNQGDLNHILGDINFISILMKKHKTLNTFLDCRLLDEFKGIKNFLFKLLWFELPIKKSKNITFISNFSKLQIEKKVKFKINNSHVIPVPLVDNLVFKINNNKKKNVLIVGTSKHKNIKNMIVAVKDLNINLTIVGELSDDLKLFCKLNKIRFKNLFNITNHRMRRVLAKNDILLMVSKYEGFGMPIIEAQASGTVAITSNLEPMKTVIGKNGFVVDPDKPTKIKKIVKKLLNDKKLFLKNIKRGQNNSYKYLSNVVNKKYINLYCKILKNDY